METNYAFSLSLKIIRGIASIERSEQVGGRIMYQHLRGQASEYTLERTELQYLEHAILYCPLKDYMRVLSRGGQIFCHFAR